MTTPAAAAATIHELLESQAMQLNERDLETLRHFCSHAESRKLCLRLAVWLGRVLGSEQKRRLFKTTAFPELELGNFSSQELVAAMTATEAWRCGTTSPMAEQFFSTLHSVVIGFVGARLLESEREEL